MDFQTLLNGPTLLSSPLVFAALVALAAGCAWLGLMPAQRNKPVEERMDDYIISPDALDEPEVLQQPLLKRTLWPLIRRILRTLGTWMPKGKAEAVQRMLILAGEPGGLSALDFYGLRVLFALALGFGWYAISKQRVPPANALLGAVMGGFAGFLLPMMWLRGQIKQRKQKIMQALPNALDMLTIGVEAGLAFESAMLRVAEQWSNPLTQELRRVVNEMRVGTARNVAMQHLADRTDVDDLRIFISIFIQSSQLGVSVSEVLHKQAAEIRDKRRMYADQMARQASVKMVFPLTFFIFPAMFVVILGPAIPQIIGLFSGLANGG